MHILLEADFESVIELVDFLDEVHLHSLLLLNVLVSDLLFLSEEGFVHGFELGLLFLIDGIDHLLEFEGLSIMRPGDISLLAVVFVFQNADIALKLLVETSHAALL